VRVSLDEIHTLRELLDARGLTMDAAAVLGQVDTATISRICSGQARATPQTVVRIARALGVNARRMARLCDQAWRDREQRITDSRDEALRSVDIDAMAGLR
jgi:plasmid maintenance system antidote protein VapI